MQPWTSHLKLRSWVLACLLDNRSSVFLTAAARMEFMKPRGNVLEITAAWKIFMALWTSERRYAPCGRVPGGVLACYRTQTQWAEIMRSRACAMGFISIQTNLQKWSLMCRIFRCGGYISRWTEAEALTCQWQLRLSDCCVKRYTGDCEILELWSSADFWINWWNKI